MSDALQSQIKTLIVETLLLDDIDPQAIDIEAPLFGEGLGLDSIDALELAIAVEKRFKVEIDADDERNKSIFSSVRALAAHIESETSAK